MPCTSTVEVQTDTVEYEPVIDITTSTPQKIATGNGKETELQDQGFILPMPESYFEDVNDPEYQPSNLSIHEEKEDNNREHVKENNTTKKADYISERKYIVFESKLMELFKVCPSCGEVTHGQIDNRACSGWGTMVRINQKI